MTEIDHVKRDILPVFITYGVQRGINLTSAPQTCWGRWGILLKGNLIFSDMQDKSNVFNLSLLY